MGAPGPNGPPSDFQPITGPGKDTVPPYKVMGLRQIGCILSGTRRKKERQGGKGNFIRSYSNSRMQRGKGLARKLCTKAQLFVQPNDHVSPSS